MPSILDHAVISRRYFFPRPERVRDPVWVESDGVRLACHWSPASTPPDADGSGRGHAAATVVHFHGNGEVVADHVDSRFTRTLNAAGLHVFFAEYRGYGGSTGVPRLAAMLGDTAAIARHLQRDRGVDPPELVVYGRSVGSIFAIELARRLPNIRGLVIESGVAAPLERLLLRLRPEELGVSDDELRREAARLVDHRRKLTDISARLLVLHARRDSLVPVDNAERLASWANGPVQTHIFETGDHNTILALHEREIADRVVDFARAHP